MIQPPKKKVRYKGVVITLYGIGWLALLTNRGRPQVTAWEKQGYLPRPVIELPNNKRRYYTVAELLGYSEIFKRSNIRRHVSISTTPFAKDCLTLHNHLKSAMVSNPKVLGQSIKESELQELSLARHQRRIANEINRIKKGERNTLTAKVEIL